MHLGLIEGVLGADGRSAPPATGDPRLRGDAAVSARTRPCSARALLALPAGVAMLAGLDAALTLLGVCAAGVRPAGCGEAHGLLMVLGFVGTLIALERAVALRQPWGYLAPALLGAGALALLVPGLDRTAPSMLAAGAAALVPSTCRCGVASATTRCWSRHSAAVLALGGHAARGSAEPTSRCCCRGWSGSSC